MRADDIFAPGHALEDIWRLINRAGLIIADISRHSANVFYELGVAPTLGKKVVIIRQFDGEESPFDINVWRHLDYGLKPTEVDKFQSVLRSLLEKHCNDYGLA